MTVEEMTPSQSWALLGSGSGSQPSALLVDVRTAPEWIFVGTPVPQAGMAPLITLEWQQFPHMQVNADFAATLDAQVKDLGGDANTPLCFLCRSGVRSHHAAQAMAAQGYTRVINITGGFEGDPDDKGQRGRINGWKVEGLPWKQS